MSPPPSPAAAAAPAGRREAGAGPATRGHLWQVDVVRLLTFSAVIAVHAVAFTEQPSDPVAAGAMMLLQFGREVFFSLTGFVLVYSTLGRPLRPGPFWKKRIAYVAVPYVAWSGLYYAYTVLGPEHAPASASAFAGDLLYGGAMYHLYFLLVTIQLYLAFPLIRRFVARTAHRALPVLGLVAALNLAWLALLQYAPAPGSGPGSWVYLHAYELLPTYAMYVLAGCYAAVHLDRLQAIVDRHPAKMMTVAAGAAVAAVAVYAAQLPFMDPRLADDVLQPGMALSCLAAVTALYAVGSRWASGPRRRQGVVATLSDASFGVYLAHPLVLALLLDYAGFGNGDQQMPAIVATVGAVILSTAGGTAIALAFRRTPLSLFVTGRPWRRAEVRSLQPVTVTLPSAQAVEAAAC